MAHLYDIGTRAWQPDPTEEWMASEVVRKNINGDKVNLVFRLDNGKVQNTYPMERIIQLLTTLLPDKNHRDHLANP